MSSLPGSSSRADGSAAITAGEFERTYAARSRMTVEQLRDLGRVVMPCNCGEDVCVGWVSVSREAAEDYKPGAIYGPR